MNRPAVTLVTGAGGVLAAAALGWLGGRASTAAERRELERCAHRDARTGLSNRTGFTAVAAAALASGAGRAGACRQPSMLLSGWAAG